MAATTAPISNMSNAFSVEGYNVLVTGGSKGIGLGIAEAFAQCGANVAILCRDAAQGREALNLLERHGTNCLCLSCNVADLNSVRSAVKEALSFWGHIDVLVNNAGSAIIGSFLEDVDLSHWHTVLATNLDGPANLCHEVAPGMIARGAGCIINISSTGAQSVDNTRTHPKISYHVSKAGLDHFTRYLASELGGTGVRVNCIEPGITHTDLDRFLPPEVFDMVDSRLPMGRFADPLEVGALCVYMASPAGCHMTGSVVVHDGGLLCMSD